MIFRSMTSRLIPGYTVYPKKYAHGFVVLCFVVVMQSFIMNSREVFIHIHQGCFAGTGAIVRLPQCQWSKPDGYGKISQCITTTTHSKAKTVCIFLELYCISSYYWYSESLKMINDTNGKYGDIFVCAVAFWAVVACQSLVRLTLDKNDTQIHKTRICVNSNEKIPWIMTSSNRNIFRVTGHLCGKFTGHWWFLHTKASDAELWCFLWSAPE